MLRRPLSAAHPLLPGSAELLPAKAVGVSCGSRASRCCSVHGSLWLICGAMLPSDCNGPWGRGGGGVGLAALVSTRGDACSCRMAKRLAAVHGHARLDCVLLLDPVATDVLPFWQALVHCVEASQQGRSPLAIGQVLRSTGDAGGASALATVPKPSGFVGTAASAAIRTPAADHRNTAGVQAFRTAAPLASAECRCPVRRPLNCGDA